MTVNKDNPRTLVMDGTELTFYWEPGVVAMPLGMTSYVWKPIADDLNADPSLSNLKIADFGSGAGFLACFAAKPEAVSEVYAYETDATSCEYIALNAQEYGFGVADKITVVNDSVASATGMEFDYIMSTAPTLPFGAKNLTASVVWKDIDPEWVNFSSDKNDVLAEQKVFIAAIAANLKEGGKGIIFHTQSQVDAIADIVAENGLTKIETQINDKHEGVAFSVDPAVTIVTK